MEIICRSFYKLININIFICQYFLHNSVYDGSGIVQHNDEWHRVSAGDFFILHPNTYHHYFVDKNNPWKKIFLTLNGDPNFFYTLLKLYKIDNVHYLKHTWSPFQLEDIFNLIKSETTNIDHDSEKLLFELVISISDFQKSHSSDVKSDKFTMAKDFIDRRITTKLSVDELRKYVNLNRSYLSRQFKQQFGLTHNEYIMIAKIEQSMQLLRTNTLTIDMISQKLAFTDKSHFTRKFKQYTGFTPSEFRKLFQTNTTLPMP